MPLHTAMTAAGIILPEELSVLHQVFEITGLPTETEKDREDGQPSSSPTSGRGSKIEMR